MAFDAATFLASLFCAIPRFRPSELRENLRYAYEERAAIKEFCGNVPRERAEAEALAEVVRTMRGGWTT